MTTETPRSLRELTSDPSYAGRVLEVIGRVIAAPSPPGVLEVLYEARAAMAVEQAVFVSFIRGEDAHENYRFMLAADPRWCFEYQANAWYGSDPWLLYASLNWEPTCASRIPAVTPQQHDVLRLAEKYGMVSVCVAPTSSPGGHDRIGMLALGTAQRGYFEDEGFNLFRMLARCLAFELHAWWCDYERSELIRTLHITDEDLQLLRLELQGGSTKHAAGELRTTSASIDSRWQRLNRKLASPHRQKTARLAAKYGLI